MMLIKKFFVGVLKRMGLYSVASKIYMNVRKNVLFPVMNIFFCKEDRRILAQLEVALEEVKCSHEKWVFLIQPSFFTRDGESYISGGGERYTCDLAQIISELGYYPILFQRGEECARDIWKRERAELLVVGVPGKEYRYLHLVSCLPDAALSIYSGFLDYGRKLKTPNLMISHGVTWDYPLQNADIPCILRTLKNIQGLVSVDTNTISWMRSTYSKYLACNPKEMYYVPNYVDLDEYMPVEKKQDEHVRVVFPRRCCVERGFWLVNDILPDVLRQQRNVVFEFVGFIHDNDINSAIEKLKKQFPTQVKHRFVEADSMFEVYQNADIAIIPTIYSEGTSLSCIEAMACGCCVVATNVGGLPNLIIPNYNGVLINPNGKELKDAIINLVNAPSRRNTLSENAVKVAQVFSKSDWRNKWCVILKEYLG